MYPAEESNPECLPPKHETSGPLHPQPQGTNRIKGTALHHFLSYCAVEGGYAVVLQKLLSQLSATTVHMKGFYEWIEGLLDLQKGVDGLFFLASLLGGHVE